MAIRKTLVALAALALAVGFTGPAAAHAHQDVLDGKYEITLGWLVEPPYAGMKNGLDLKFERYLDEGEVSQNDGHGHSRAQEPVTEGILGNVTVTYEYAGRTFTPPDFRAQPGKPGEYTAEITPTREGEYTVHITGTLGGEPLDVRMKPQAVESTKSTMFPVEDLSEEEQSTRIQDLEAQVKDLEVKVAALQANAQGEAQEEAPTSEQKGTPAPGVALVALAAVGAALYARRR